jgi:hypothetical protein
MSTTPATPVVAAPNPYPHIKEGMDLLKKRLRPAILVDDASASGNKNGFFFHHWFQSKGLNTRTMTAVAIAEEGYRAVQNDCTKATPELIWSVPPATLLKRAEQNKVPGARQDAREASTFEELAHAGDAANIQKTAQRQARARCEVLVERFVPTRRGSIARDLQEKTRKDWTKRIENTTDHISLEKEIRKESASLYEQVEKAAEKLQ